MSVTLHEMLLGASTKNFGSFTAVSSRYSTSSNIQYPAGILAGDLVLYIERCANAAGTSPPPLVTVPGFTNITTFTDTPNSPSVRRMAFSWKIANGTESSTTIGGMSGTDTNTKSLIIFRSSTGALVSSVVASDIGLAQSASNPVTLNTTTTGLPENTVLVFFGTGTLSATISMTQTPTDFTQNVTPQTFMKTEYQIFPNGVTSDYSVVCNRGSGGWVACQGLSLTLS